MKLLIALLFCSPVFASDFECNYEGSQREMNQCAINEFFEADNALNNAYMMARIGLSKEEIEALRIQQRQWIKRRDAVCKPKLKAGGSLVVIDYLDCLTVKTELRTMQLKSLKNRER